MNPFNVISILQQHFNSFKPSEPISNDEQLLGKHIVSIMENAMNSSNIEIIDNLVTDDAEIVCREEEEEISDLEFSDDEKVDVGNEEHSPGL